MLLLFTVSAFAQTKEEALEWMRSHLKTVVIHNNDSLLPYTMTKTYTFYDDALVVKTVKDFYKDTSLNSPPAFGKVWYRDIFTENDTAIVRGIQKEQSKKKVFVYTIWAEHVYSIIEKENAPLPFWRTFDEPMGLDLYFTAEKNESAEIVKKLYQLAAFWGAKTKPNELLTDN